MVTFKDPTGIPTVPGTGTDNCKSVMRKYNTGTGTSFNEFLFLINVSN